MGNKRSFRLQPSYEDLAIGVDIGAHNVKFLCLDRKAKGTAYVAHGFFKCADLKGFKTALHHRSLRSGQLCVSIQSPKIRINKFELPKAPEKEIDGMVKWALRDSLGGPLEDYVVRYFSFASESESELVPYLAFTMEKRILEDFQGKLKEFAIYSPSIIEPHINAYANYIISTYKPAANEVYALLDCGETQATFVVSSAMRLLYYRALTGISGEFLNAEIARDLGVSLQQAVQYKINQTEISGEQSVRLNDSILRYLAKLCIEVQNSIDSYHVQFPRQPITGLLLAGGSCALTQMQASLQRVVSVPVSYIQAPQGIPIDNFLNFGIAMGLAL